MSAPRVKIYFQNGLLGLVSGNDDGVLGLLCTGVAVAGTFALSTPYILRGPDSLTPLGITAANNPSLVKLLTDFYDEAGDGAELWMMAFPDTVKLSDMVDPAVTTRAKALMNAANGKIQGFIVSRSPAVGYAPTITNGLDADVALAVSNAELLATWCEDTKAAPIFTLIEGYGYNGNPVSLADLTAGSADHTAVFIGATTAVAAAATNVPASIGLLAGRVAKNSIEVNVGRKKDGPVKTLTAYLADKKVEDADWVSIHDKGYITLRTWTGTSGYFFNDDSLATDDQDDYSHLTARRTINKAYRIAYQTLTEKMLDGIPVNSDGTTQYAVAKSWEADVEREIAASMTAKGQLSNDPTNPNDKGVKCVYDLTVNVVATSSPKVKISVRPFAYARYVDGYLGFGG